MKFSIPNFSYGVYELWGYDAMWKSISTGHAAVEEAVRQFLPPCQIQCPINEDIQRTNVLISLLPEDPDLARDGIIQIGDYLYEKNPLFTICGYVCGLCELECNYQSKGGAIKRRLLKRFISDTYTYYLDKKEPFQIERHKAKVAIAGGGPAGLMCAYHLSRKGYRVRIFEGSDRLGGALWLIPKYRLPEKVLASAIDNLIRIAGIEVQYGANVGQGELTLDVIRKEGFKAVFVGKGTPAPRVLSFGREDVPGQDLSGVMYGQNFLYEVSHGDIKPNYFRGKKVLVIGGGNVAFDVARTARRLGGETTIVCLECEDRSSKDRLPADWDEVRGAWEEGIRIQYSRGVRRIVGERERVKKIECPRCTSVYDEKGFNPKFDVEDTIPLEGDVLIITVGQGPDKQSLQSDDLLDDKGRLAVDPMTLQSQKKGWVFIGGDLRKIGFMVDAMKDGLVAAESIERYLKGMDMKEGRKRDYAGQDIPLRRYYEEEPEVLWIPPEKRMHFKVFEKGFTLSEAVEEAKRCLTCGPCISCKACLSLGIQDALPVVEVNPERCSGCGICASVCYYSAAQMKEVEDKRISITDLFRCKSCGLCVVACPSNARRLVGDPMDQRINEMYQSLRS
jgi:NADPH-dependent glutamate synthase beta subunit-like oxidoreductase/NAD-dependent dihydropyrimidine dehydrogenase PreA subunit